MDILILSN